MTSLDRLIQRIEYPLKVSIEDALDVIQKYWDEAANTVSTYWNDTDKEIAEEVGVPKQSLSEILDQHGNGQAYANMGGNSGVDSYVDGYGWILVNFTTGAKYLYTTKSTTEANIEQMKQYARDGKGLNSFIMRITKDGYAGNNIKGNILIRPGMEHYTEQANKRLSILHAFRDAKMTIKQTVSQEGIGDLITKVKNLVTGRDEHGVKGSDTKPGAVIKAEKSYSNEAKAQVKQLKDVIKRYYQNTNWISKQILVTGEVDGQGISPTLNFNGQLGNEPLTNIDKGISWADQWVDKWLAVVKERASKVKQINIDVVSFFKANEDDDKREACVKKAIQQFKALPDPFSKFPKPNGCGLGNRAPVILNIKARGVTQWLGVKVVKPLQEGNLPALTKEQIHTAGDLIIKLLDQEYDREYISWLDHSDGSVLNEWFEEHDHLSGMYYTTTYHQSAEQIYLDGMNNLVDTYAVITALDKWIDRSIKSNVATENYKMTQTTLQGFKQQLDTAGRDGLDVTARKFMAVGIQHASNKPQVSTEDFSTQTLEQTLEQALKDC